MMGGPGPVFPYGREETDHLSARDPRLGRAIAAIGMVRRPVQPDLFTAIVESIIAQQISAKAAATVTGRVRALWGERARPEHVLAADPAALQACGLSWRKVGHIRGAAEAAVTGRLRCDLLPGLEDREVIARLASLDGVGVWTAEMLLLFSLCRGDVVSYGDLAIRRGMMRLYRRRDLPRAAFERYRKRYSPHGSVASLYLWRIAAMETPPDTSSPR